jgi:N-acetylneuraminate synthase
VTSTWQKIEKSKKTFVIAEAGVNHNGSLDRAKRLIDVAARSGCDAVKFQIFNARQLVADDTPKVDYQVSQSDISETQYDMLRRLELSYDAHRELKKYCEDTGILYISTPFDKEGVDFLNDLGVCCFKIGSGDITNFGLLKNIASKGKPVILSTGMAFLSEIDEAVRLLRRSGCEQFVLLHCVSEYPASEEHVNLRAMTSMRAAFDVPIGYSDHTLGIEVSLAAVALGACVIEKHFTLDRNLPGPDHKASLEPDELSLLVKGIRRVELALGTSYKSPSDKEAEIAVNVRRSIVAACDMSAGCSLTEECLDAKRLGMGLPANLGPHLVGRKLRVSVKAGTMLELDMLA